MQSLPDGGSSAENDGYTPSPFISLKKQKKRMHYFAWYSMMNTLRAGGFLVQSAAFDCSSWETGEWNRLVSLFKVCTCV